MLHSRARSSVPQPMASPSLAVSPAALGLPPVLEWQAQEVASFLASLKCGHLAPVFEQNDITGDVILELDMSHLKEMGVTRVGDRVRLQVGLKALRSSTFAAAASTPVTPRHSVGMRGSPSVTGIHAGVEGAVARGPSPRLEDQAGPTDPLRTTASHIRQASSNDSRSRTSSGSSGHRPAPLDIAGTFARDPRLPQVYQPGARPIVPRSASSSSILPLAAATISQPAYVPRPIGSLPDISAPTLAHRPSRDTSLRQAGSTPSGSTLRPPGNHPQQPPEIMLPSEPSLGAPSGHLKAAELSTGSAGGSFTERRALRALERENRSGRPSTAPGASGSASAPRLVPPSMAGPSAPSGSASVTLGVNGRPAPLAALSSHPFATTPATPSSPSYPPLSSAHPPSDILSSSTDSLTLSAPSSSTLAPSRSNSSLRSTGGTTPSLEDLKYKIVKFINPEDGNTRVVDVTDCSGGWDVLEKVLRKFGKWREGGSGARGLGVADDSDDEEGRGAVVLDGWGVYLEGYGGEGIGHPLTESELLSVCHAPVDSPARNRGLTLKRVKKLGNRKQVEKFFGEAPPQPASPTSPTYFAGAATPRDSVAAGKDGLSAGAKKMNRASTISVMAGLGVDGLKQAQQPPPPMPLSPAVASSSPAPTPAATTTATSATRSPSSGSFLISKGRKMYNFFGHRPPSELISTHLTEYFPKVQKKVLERTARNSMMRITSGDGGVRGSWATAGGEGSARLSTSSFGDSIASPRKKRISQGARSIASSNLSGGAKHHPLHRTSTSPPRSAIPEDASPDDPVGLPRVSISTDGVSESESEAGSVDSRPPLLPPVDTSADSWSDSLSIYSPNFIAAGDALRRNSIASARPMSLLSQFHRRKKDTSDTASFLTVDEITAHVDSKRSSQDSASAAEDGIEVIDDEDLDEDDDDVRTPAPPGRRFSRGSRRLDRVMSYYESSHGSGEDEDEGAYSDEAEDEDDEDEDEDSDDDEADEAADEQGKAFLSEGGKRSFKWIKGALIGSGSFGSVFLGMDASRGLLMAVKQVDIPTGVSANEERKKEMLNALEREIELLKELQHDNIVQYLDSSIDASHLNIFLEYVPGGSVTALLSNYGAFEEALVRVFIRQTLQGLAYLHDKGIIHRDIKGANILVDNKGGIKISDFGISKKVESDLLDNSNNRKSLQGTVFWMAPEVVKQTAHTTKADIWSVGCLVVEMLTGQRPWGRLDQMQVMFKIGSLSRPELPPDITSEAEDFLEKTFMLDFHARPTAVDLLAHDFIQADLDPTGDA